MGRRARNQIHNMQTGERGPPSVSKEFITFTLHKIMILNTGSHPPQKPQMICTKFHKFHSDYLNTAFSQMYQGLHLSETLDLPFGQYGKVLCKFREIWQILLKYQDLTYGSKL